MTTKGKDFSAIDTNRNYGNAIAEATAEAPAPASASTLEDNSIRRHSREDDPYTAEEINQARTENKTQGRKGLKAIRICMAFKPDVHDFLALMSRRAGMSITAYTDHLLRKAMAERAEAYEKAKEQRDEVL